MANLPPPLPPQQQRSNQTLLAVVIGVVLVIGIIVGSGLFLAFRIARGTHIEETQANGQKLVVIQSPLGNLRVNGDGDNATVDIDSPFGNLHVKPVADPASIGIDLYPGAVLVNDAHNSPFHGYNDYDLRDNHVALNGDGNATGAQVEMSSGNAHMDVEVGEFRTPASPTQVLNFYRDRLQPLGAVDVIHHADGATELKLRLANDNVRVVSIKSGGDGTHFVLVRVAAASGAK